MLFDLRLGIKPARAAPAAVPALILTSKVSKGCPAADRPRARADSACTSHVCTWKSGSHKDQLWCIKHVLTHFTFSTAWG
jgi:hypothetical protein